jgi:hypothetical protein
MKLKKLALIAVSIVGMLLPLHGYAEAITGSQNKELRSKCKKDRPRSTEEFNQVLSQAKINALRAWAAGKSVAISTLFAENEQTILANIDDYFLNAQVDYRCKNKSFKLKVKGLVDVNRIGLLGKASTAQIAGPRSEMVAVFVARKANTVKSFDDKRTTIEQTSTFNEGAESVSVGGSSASTEGFTSEKNVAVSGGSTVSKADQTEWVVYNAGGLDAAVNQTFSSYGFSLVESSQIAARDRRFDLEAFKQDFGSGDDLSPRTKNDAFDALDEFEIPMLVIATVDMGQTITDGVSGEKRVFATVTAQVYFKRKRFYSTVASVGPAQVDALGRTQQAAENSALRKAAEAASSEIVQQLNTAGIK